MPSKKKTSSSTSAVHNPTVSANDIAYQNKDIASKIFGEGMKEKSLSVYGVPVPKIIQVLPTNLPAIEANELRMDNLFLLEDGSYALVDYESKYQQADKIKYINYIARTLKRLYAEGIHHPKLRMIVLYTSDVKKAATKLDIGCLRFRIEAGYLADLDTKKITKKIKRKIRNRELLEDKELMQLIILPLAVQHSGHQKKLLKKSIHLAKALENQQQQVFALSGILTFSDKIIDAEYAEQIRRWIQMTKVAQIFEREKEEAVKKAIEAMQAQVQAAEDNARLDKRKIRILQLLVKGKPISEIAEIFHMKTQDIVNIIEED